MPIATDAVSSGAQNAVTELTVAHTCTGDNRILFVAVQIGSTSDLITGITYAGAAMTQIGAVSNVNRTYLWYILAPATGANNIVISASSSVNIRCGNSSYTGAQQSGVPDASATNTASAATSITTSVTTVADNCWVVSASGNDLGSMSAGTGTTLRAQPSPASISIGDNGAAKTPAGAVSMQWTAGSSAGWENVNASFAPVPPPPSAISGYKSLLGVGQA